MVYVHKERRLVFFHHGDDFILMGSESASAWYRDQLAQHFIVKGIEVYLVLVHTTSMRFVS